MTYTTEYSLFIIRKTVVTNGILASSSLFAVYFGTSSP